VGYLEARKVAWTRGVVLEHHLAIKGKSCGVLLVTIHEVALLTASRGIQLLSASTSDMNPFTSLCRPQSSVRQLGRGVFHIHKIKRLTSTFGAKIPTYQSHAVKSHLTLPQTKENLKSCNK
jgi:hypothetical protein